jgi:hypothetical protein
MRKEHTGISFNKKSKESLMLLEFKMSYYEASLYHMLDMGTPNESRC